MSRTVILLLGLIALALLIFLCIRKHTPVIQDDIQTRTSTLLSPVPTDWAKVTVDGRNVLLTGVAPTEALREKAAEMARAVPGVVSVDNQITVNNVPIEPIVEKEPEPQIISPYETSFVKDGSGVVLSGLVPNQEQRDALYKHAEEKFGVGNVTDRLQIASGAPEDWLKAAMLAVGNLTYFNDGVTNLNDTQLDFSGNILDDAAKSKLEGDLPKLLPGNFKADFDLTVPQLAVEQIHPEPLASETGSNCKDKFSKHIAGKTIHFSTDSAGLAGKSRMILNKVLEFSASCPNSIIQVSGYTDSRGSSAYNMNLSKKRAEAVVRTLIKRGISANLLKSVGYGETRPLSENTTSSGQANNRRIEFTYLQEGE